MNLELTARQRALELAVAGFVADWLPLHGDDSSYFAALSDRGWSAPGWPTPWGGGLGPMETFLVERTLALAGAPMLAPPVLHHLGPLLLRLADAGLCQQLLPAMASGRIRWAVHGSLLGAEPLSGRLLGDEVRLDVPRILVNGASQADAVALLFAGNAETALAMAELPETAVYPNQPLDPHTVDLEVLDVRVLATTRTHPKLLSALAARGRPGSGSGQGRWGCWTGRLRHQFDRLTSVIPPPLIDPELSSIEVDLRGQEAMELRAVASADVALAEAVAIRCAELGRSLSRVGIDHLGYYALAASETIHQHNERPEQALAAWGAMAELIRYLEGDFGAERDALAQNLGIASKPGN